MTRTFVYSIAACIVAAGLLACGSSTPEPSASTPAATAPEGGTAALPSGHPPTGGGTGGLAGPPPNSGTGSNALNWQPPAGWEWVQPANAMRRAQYKVPGSAGDGECVVYYFGPGQGGDAMSNAVRWAAQFSQPDGSSTQDVMKTENIMVGDMSVLLIEVTGSYGGGMPGMGAGGEPKTDQMLLGAVAAGPDANWFFKLTGPQASINEQSEAFETMINSLTAGGDEI